MKSVPPPAGNGTIILIGLFGHVCAVVSAGVRHATTIATTTFFRTLLIFPSSGSVNA